jgi:hypothetical protein
MLSDTNTVEKYTFETQPERAWSVLDPRPVQLYLPLLDEYIVYWNGVVMTHAQALCMTLTHFGSYPTPEMKQAMKAQYERIYYAGGFGTRAWDDLVESGGDSATYSYLKRIMEEHITKCLDSYKPDVVLSWFDHDRARGK